MTGLYPGSPTLQVEYLNGSSLLSLQFLNEPLAVFTDAWILDNSFFLLSSSDLIPTLIIFSGL